MRGRVKTSYAVNYSSFIRRLLSKINETSITEKLYIDIHFPLEYGYIL